MSVYIWGNGSQGQLGLGSLIDKLDPIIIDSFRGNIKDIASGEKHCLAVNELGDVFVWGRGRDGQGGNNTKEAFIKVPTKVKALEPERIVKVRSGSYHCLALNTRGQLFEWGMLHRFNDQGESIYGGPVKMPGMNDAAPQEDELDKKRREMIERSLRQYYAGRAGFDYQDNTINKESIEYDKGVANFGNFTAQLQCTPVLVRDLENVNIVDASAGYAFSMAISDKGNLYAWGFNEKRQLGLGHRYNQDKPQLVRSLSDANIKVDQVACGQQHVLALSSDGQVYSWGMGVFGQLGHGNVHDSGFPKIIEALADKKIIQVACGSNHSLALSEDGKVYTWGSSEYGQQPGKNKYTDWQEGDQHTVGRRKNFYAEPRPIDDGFNGKKVLFIGCGSLHNLAITETGECYTWGWGINGALGHGNRRLQPIPRVILRLRGEKIVRASAGSYSSMVVTSGGESTYALDFKHLINNKNYSDITFMINGKPIHLHRGLIYSRCPKLKQQIETSTVKPEPEPEPEPVPEEVVLSEENDSQESDSPVLPPVEKTIEIYKTDNPNVYNVENAEFYILLAFIRYLYTDQLNAPEHHIPKISGLATFYDNPRLQALCKRFLSFHHAALFDEGKVVEVPASTFSKDLLNSFNNSEATDIVIALSDQSQVRAHRAILSSRSDYFRTIFEGGFKESSKEVSRISTEEINLNIFIILLKFIYGNEITEENDEVAELLVSSSRFLLEDMSQRIEKRLEDNIDMDNAVALLALGETTNTQKLRNACINFIVDNLATLKNSLRENNAIPPQTIKHIEFLNSKKAAVEKK